MARLIDANELLVRMKVVTEDTTCPLHIAATIDQEIELAPTVDAVVLPCKIGDDVYIIPSKVNFDLNVLSGLKKKQ